MKQLVSMLVVAWLGSGCATLLKGTSEDVKVTSKEPGQLFVDDRLRGTTPLTLQLDHGPDYTLRLEQPGAAPKVQQLTSSFSGWTLLGGLIGVVVDLGTGAIKTLDETEVNMDKPAKP